MKVDNLLFLLRNLLGISNILVNGVLLRIGRVNGHLLLFRQRDIDINIELLLWLGDFDVHNVRIDRGFGGVRKFVFFEIFIEVLIFGTIVVILARFVQAGEDAMSGAAGDEE